MTPPPVLGDEIVVEVVDPFPVTVVEAPPAVPDVEVLAVPGPPGAAGSGAFYVHTQGTAAGTWTIPHGLGRIPHAVTVYIAGELVDTDTHVDAIYVVLTFAAPAAGVAHIL